MTTVQLLRLQPMHIRPAPGRKVTVRLKDGRIIECHSTRVMVMWSGADGVVMYHRRKAIDESKAEGWAYSTGATP